MTFLFRYGGIPGFDNINKRARTTLSQFEVISANGGTAEMSGVFQVQNCITVFAASWHRLQSKVKRQVNPRHSLLRYLVDPDKLRSRRQKCQTMAKLIHRFPQSSVKDSQNRRIDQLRRCNSLPPRRPTHPPTENFDVAVKDRALDNRDEEVAYLDTDEEAQQLKASYGRPSSSSSSTSKKSKKRKRSKSRNTNSGRKR